MNALDVIQRNNYLDQFGFNTASGMPAMSTGSSGGTSLSLSNIFNSGMSILSQIIAGKSTNPNTQVISGQGGVTAIQSTPYGSAGNVSANQTAAQQAALAAQSGGVGSQAIGVGAGLFDGLASSFGISTSTLMLLGIGGAYLLFRQPPRGR